MTSDDIARGLAAEAGLAPNDDAVARLARQIEGLRASAAKLAALDLHETEPAFIFTPSEGDHA